MTLSSSKGSSEDGKKKNFIERVIQNTKKYLNGNSDKSDNGKYIYSEDTDDSYYSKLKKNDEFEDENYTYKTKIYKKKGEDSEDKEDIENTEYLIKKVIADNIKKRKNKDKYDRDDK